MAIQGPDTNQTQSCWCRTFTQQHFPEKEGRKAAQTQSAEQSRLHQSEECEKEA